MPQRGDKRILMETVARNAGQSLATHKTKRASDFTTRTKALEEIQRALRLEDAPLRIECYDVSNLQGTEVVASMVVFEDGLPRKSDYRRFVIKGVDGQNDVAAMHETISRRFRRLLDERAESTEVDLGRRRGSDEDRGPVLDRPRHRSATQVRVRARAGRGRRRPTAGRGRAARPRRARHRRHPRGGPRQAAGGGVGAQAEDPVILPRTSEGLYLLQRVRDEAHRFAITHHRNRRSKSMVESVLDDVPGLGEVRRKVLMRHFGSLEEAARRQRRRHRGAARVRAADGDSDHRRAGAELAARGSGCQHDYRGDPRR